FVFSQHLLHLQRACFYFVVSVVSIVTFLSSILLLKTCFICFLRVIFYEKAASLLNKCETAFILVNFLYWFYSLRFGLFTLLCPCKKSFSDAVSASYLARVSYFFAIFFCFPLSLLRFLFCSDIYGTSCSFILYSMYRKG